MKYYGAKELAESLRTVRKNTLIVAGDIPEDKYAFRPATGTRSVSENLVHIVTSHQFMHRFHGKEHRNSFAGLDYATLKKEFDAEEKKPRKKAEIIELLRSNGDAFASWVEGLSEEFMAEQVEMPPGTSPASKSRFETLLGAKEHEMHHRGQLMLIERMIGIVPHLTREREGASTAARTARA